MLRTDTWRMIAGKWHVLVSTMSSTTWASFLAHTERASPLHSQRQLCSRGTSLSPTTALSQARWLRDQPVPSKHLIPGKKPAVELSQDWPPASQAGMPLLLEDTPRKAGESGLLLLTGLTPHKGLFHFCQGSGMLHYQLPKECTDKGIHGQTPCLRPSTGRGAVNCDLGLLRCGQSGEQI